MNPGTEASESGVAEAAVPACVVEQRATAVYRGLGHADDLADHDAVVTPVVHRRRPAFERGERAVKDGRTGEPARVVRMHLELGIEWPAPGGQPARGLLRVFVEDRHGPQARGENGIVETGDLLRAEQHEQRLEGHRRERVHRHRVPGPVQRGGDHDDAGGELAGGTPVGCRVHVRARLAVHRPALPLPGSPPCAACARVQRTIVTAEPIAAQPAPPYRYHSPAPVLVMITLPPEFGMASKNDARIQPSAGTRAPPSVRIAQPPARQVIRIPAQNPNAATGTDPIPRLYWKHPTRPSIAPSRNSTP